MATPNTLELNGFTFAELFTASGLKRLDHEFLTKLKPISPELYDLLIGYRTCTINLPAAQLSEFLIALAYQVEDFLLQLFTLESAASKLQAQTISHNPVADFKKFFILRRVKKHLTKSATLPDFAQLNIWLKHALANSALQTDDQELAIALLANEYLSDIEKFAAEIEQLTYWCVQAIMTPDGQAIIKEWTSFRIPQRIEYDHLIHYQIKQDDPLQRMQAPTADLYLRDGFKLTDNRMNARAVQDEATYCIYCHDHDGDFCSKGFPVKKGDPAQGLKQNPLDLTLTGCPLDEKISEMNFLKREGYTLAALAMVMVDNPMCPATGHRICNDCMKACIYQKQDPVNIPQIETRVLTDVLHLPWGVEIYDLLTRWNPLRQTQFVMQPYNGQKIMIAGMGPAGFTLAHHLLLEGCAVVGFDGLKIEPLPNHLITEPIYAFSSLTESLDERLMAGFGGVAEYGITVRWDKNFLKLIYLSLMRKPYFQVFGSARFGGTVTIDEAWRMGFDHFAIAVGAGLPKALAIPGSLAPGMRQANDFLMALQLGNAAKSSSLTNLQIRLPAVVIGGGLTGVDTATEVQAYYIAQVEKVLSRYEKLLPIYGEEFIYAQLDNAATEILHEYLAHGQAVLAERERASTTGQKPNFIKLIHAWGGVTIVYRRSMQDSPAYINNHEELQKALGEGVFYLEKLEPKAARLNPFGHVETLVCQKRLIKADEEWETTAEEIILPARSIFVATGTQPNIAYEFEHRGTFNRLGVQYQHYEAIDETLTLPTGIAHCKEKNFGAFTSYQKDQYRVSLVGDTHPVFHGNVVKAIASGMRTYPKIMAVLKAKENLADENEYQQFASDISHAFNAKVLRVERRAHNVIELTIHAPLAAKQFRPGQFYRLQNYETYAQRHAGTVLQMEPLALVAASVNLADESLTFMVIENGASTKLCATLTIGEPVSLMGPTGTKAKISHEHETILIVGEQISLALLRSYGSALRLQGNRVLYAGYFATPDDVYCQNEVEAATDAIIWTTKSAELIKPNRATDYSIQGDLMQSLKSYAAGTLFESQGSPLISLADVDRIYVIGSTGLLRQFQHARLHEFKKIFLKDPAVVGSVYSSMQCMLKGVCAQCLQWQIDPETGLRTKAVFACSWPEQPLELIDFDNLDERRSQNMLQEKLNDLWVDYLLQVM
jgi:NADPH-dependent glutamate synthase beta subunit-like oxidoreductase/NAD(P)H-flavin reductase